MPETERVLMLDVGALVPSPFQPRQSFDEVKLKELAESIRAIGVMQPVIVRRREGAKGQRDAGERGGALADKQPVAQYELVAGERRLRAAKLAGLARVPALVRELDDESCAAWGLIENVQRDDLDPMERAWACRTMLDRFGLGPTELADRLGLDRSTVSNLMRLTELDATTQAFLRRGDLSMGHARALLGAPDGSMRLALATLAATEGWSVRRLEAEVRKNSGPRKGRAGGGSGGGTLADRAGKSASLADLEKRLGEHLGTRVTIRPDRSGKRGKLELAFFDLDHFDGLMQKMGFGKQ